MHRSSRKTSKHSFFTSFFHPQNHPQNPEFSTPRKLLRQKWAPIPSIALYRKSDILDRRISSTRCPHEVTQYTKYLYFLRFNTSAPSRTKKKFRKFFLVRQPLPTPFPGTPPTAMYTFFFALGKKKFWTLKFSTTPKSQHMCFLCVQVVLGYGRPKNIFWGIFFFLVGGHEGKKIFVGKFFEKIFFAFSVRKHQF